MDAFHTTRSPSCRCLPGDGDGYVERMSENTQNDTTPVEQNAEKDPSDWVTGDEPITGAQRSYLETLAQEAGETAPDGLTKAEASQKIDELQNETGRGQS
ncbi:hypothetical protein RhoFasK5_01513|nr:hypothetical protein [Rhodococcus kroppenstedtii]